jgi:hypothetical protein
MLFFRVALAAALLATCVCVLLADAATAKRLASLAINRAVLMSAMPVAQTPNRMHGSFSSSHYC